MNAYRKQLRDLARESFKDHTVSQINGTTWLCAKPGTFIYGFYVAFVGGRIVVTGDIGDAIFTNPSINPKEWLIKERNGWEHTDYPLSKLVPAVKYHVFVSEMAKETIAQLKVESDGESADTLEREWDGVSKKSWNDACSHVYYDLDYPPCTDYAPNAYWCWFALMKWRDLFLEYTETLALAQDRLDGIDD